MFQWQFWQHLVEDLQKNITFFFTFYSYSLVNSKNNQ